MGTGGFGHCVCSGRPDFRVILLSVRKAGKWLGIAETGIPSGSGRAATVRKGTTIGRKEQPRSGFSVELIHCLPTVILLFSTLADMESV